MTAYNIPRASRTLATALGQYLANTRDDEAHRFEVANRVIAGFKVPQFAVTVALFQAVRHG